MIASSPNQKLVNSEDQRMEEEVFFLREVQPPHREDLKPGGDLEDCVRGQGHR